MSAYADIVPSNAGLPQGALGHLNVFSTSPQSLNANKSTYLTQLSEVARWSERAGCSGILVYTDNAIVDPWLVAQVIIREYRHTCAFGSRSAGLYASVFCR